MRSQFEELRQQLIITHVPDERKILLKGMARVGSFEELSGALLIRHVPDERKILLEAMVRVGRFKQLSRQLLYTSLSDERKTLLEAMAQVGSFKELICELPMMRVPDERKILLKGMARVGSFEELRRELLIIHVPDERKILLKGMARVSDFEELRRELLIIHVPDERKILLEAMARVSDFEQPRQQLGKQYDVFIAHASEDKGFVTPLALSLRRRGLKVWYDDFVLKIGDSLRREIDRGLAQSRYGLVVLSDNFFGKHWPQKELDGLTAKEQLGKKGILPVWHNIDREEVAHYSPTLADIYAVKSSIGIEAVTDEIIKAISR